MKKSLVSETAEEVAKELGLESVIEDKWGYVGKITLKNGEFRYFRNTYLDLNNSAAAEIARDKSYTNFFLEEMGYRTPQGKYFLADDYAEHLGQPREHNKALDYAKQIGFPLVIKPNAGAQGKGVSSVKNQEQLDSAIFTATANDDIFLIQELVVGSEYRLCVLDDQLEIIYKRLPMTLVGDGQSSLEELLNKAVKNITDRGIRLPKNLCLELKKQLHNSGHDIKKIIAEGEELRVTDISNLSQGGSILPIDKNALHDSWQEFASKLCADMGLRFCGIDIITDSNITDPLTDPVVLDINAAPGFYHYASLREGNRQEVRDLYRKAIKKMCEI